MCGIWASLNAAGLPTNVRAALLAALAARGPEYTALVDLSGAGDVALGFTRLAINGLTPAGHQPFTVGSLHTVCNGEIYNYKELAERHNIVLAEGTSDCAILPALVARGLTATELVRALDGVFAFVVVDEAAGTLLVARDPYGVRPLFYGRRRSPAGGPQQQFWASELKGLPADCDVVEPFPPGTWRRYDTRTGLLLEAQRYHSIPHGKLPLLTNAEHARTALRVALESAVKKRLMSDRPIGALLSGGVDSSLVAAIAARELGRQGKRIHTFSIGMPGSTDLAYAGMVAAHINSIHHEIVVDPATFLEAIPAVVRAAETYDITSVRASVGNYLVGKYIRENTDIKVVFNGDGSDEIGGGYLYFYAAPNDEAFESECERLLEEIHLFDVLRSDRSMAAHGLEARTPFLDKSVVATWCAIATALRRPNGSSGSTGRVEKQILREAFADTGLLPNTVLWRKKEAFSDGVSATTDSWYARCAAHASATGAAAADLEAAASWHNPPRTAEAYWYRTLFEAAYGSRAAAVIPHMWMPRWVAGATDPSARTLTTLYSSPN
jgi:asparagine synthase (glutamine-hydrolysing)